MLIWHLCEEKLGLKEKRLNRTTYSFDVHQGQAQQMKISHRFVIGARGGKLRGTEVRRQRGILV